MSAGQQLRPEKPDDWEKIRRDDLRAEYAAVVSYHTALVVARFTIAGLITGGSAFLATAAFNPDKPPALKAFCCVFAVWITFCAWILELRSRALYRTIAKRGRRIERKHWGLNCYEGFFSRQYYNDAPLPDEYSGSLPIKSDTEVPDVLGIKLHAKLAEKGAHSRTAPD